MFPLKWVQANIPVKSLHHDLYRRFTLFHLCGTDEIPQNVGKSIDNPRHTKHIQLYLSLKGNLF